MRYDLTNVWVLEKTVWGVGYGRSAFPSGVGWEIVMSGVWGANPHKKNWRGSQPTQGKLVVVRVVVGLVWGCETGVYISSMLFPR